jgi:hypothetical protein
MLLTTKNGAIAILAILVLTTNSSGIRILCKQLPRIIQYSTSFVTLSTLYSSSSILLEVSLTLGSARN